MRMNVSKKGEKQADILNYADREQTLTGRMESASSNL